MKKPTVSMKNKTVSITRMARLFTSLLFASGLGLPAGAQSVETGPVVEGNTAFALDLYARLGDAPGNVFFSPYSISTCLAMTYAGARGDTETQMSQVLHLGTNQGPVHLTFGELQRELNEAQRQRGIQLDLANALWAQKGKAFLPHFLKIVGDDYQASVHQTDFTTAGPAVVREINRWVAGKTHDRIQDVLSPASLNRDSRLVLVNAIYFKGAWATPFKRSATSKQPFHLTEDSQTDVPLMHRSAEFKYTENGDFQALEMPYRGDQLSMVILLPRHIATLGPLEKQLSAQFLENVFARMGVLEVEVYLPAFKLESDLDLRATLSKMGMPDAFDSLQADFSGLNGLRDLSISGVFHKAWVKVGEEGTEAAAATEGGMISASVREMPMPMPVFRADHPFVFLIRDTRSGSVLFIGRLADP